MFPKLYTMSRHLKQGERSNGGLREVQECGSHDFLEFQNKMMAVLVKMVLGYKVAPSWHHFFLIGGLLLLKMALGLENGTKACGGTILALFFIQSSIVPLTFLFFINIY